MNLFLILLVARVALAAPTTSVAPSCQDYGPTCYGYGDPHYITFGKQKFKTNTSCSHVLATDSCHHTSSSHGTYKIIVNHATRSYNQLDYYIESVDMHLYTDHSAVVYSLGRDGEFKIGNETHSIPYNDDLVRVYASNYLNYVVLEAINNGLRVQYDGSQLLKFNECGSMPVCGLCGSKSNEQLVEPETWSLCKHPILGISKAEAAQKFLAAQWAAQSALSRLVADERDEEEEPATEKEQMIVRDSNVLKNAFAFELNAQDLLSDVNDDDDNEKKEEEMSQQSTGANMDMSH